MREVSGCDFCGNTPSGTFDVLPREYDPEGKGERMVLCDHCRDALASILDPLLDTATEDIEPRVGADASRQSGDVADSGRTDGTARGDAVSDTTPGRPDATTSSGSRSDTTASSGPRMAKTADGTSSRVPKGYRKTLRFLENREMPVAREAAVEMVSDAYGFDPEAVEAAIDHAVKHGRLKQLQDEIDVA